MTLLQSLNHNAPPYLCRLLARRGRGSQPPLTSEEIADASGLPVSTVNRVSKLEDWTGVPVDVVSKFMAACGVNPFSMRRHREYIVNGKFAHVEKSAFLKRILRTHGHNQDQAT